ncbi:MAG TPA: heme-binding protein [Bryobacteraceae bacterium]|nr:heme-binding protein [Bryobacteraceae bacterium]
MRSTSIRVICAAACLAVTAVAFADGKKNNGNGDGNGNSQGDGNGNGQGDGQGNACKNVPSFSSVQSALTAVVASAANGGLGFNMWATIVNRDGVVCLVTFSGADRGSQWPGSRVISAQKANTANAFSLPKFALSTANLYSAVQPGGSLFGLQESNPVDTGVAYGGDSGNYGQPNDPMVGGKIGGINVFGGGLALYSSQGTLVGGLGVSGDTSCTDHIIAWKVRHALNFDDVPAGVGTGNTDNIIFDITEDSHGNLVSASGFGHPTCGAGAPSTAIAVGLPTNFPVGPNP